MPKNTVGNREATQPTQTMMTTRSRKIQPDLREKAENYLARANVSDLSSSCQKSAPKARKRKLQDVVDAEKHQSLNSTRALETNTSVFASVPKLTGKPSEKASRALKPKKDKLSQLKDAPESDLDRPLSVPEAVKKSSKPESPKEPDEKRLKRYRKQAPQSFLQKLHRAQTQR